MHIHTHTYLHSWTRTHSEQAIVLLAQAMLSVSLIGSAQTKEGPWMPCCSYAHSVYRDALCCANTYKGALDMTDLCAI